MRFYSDKGVAENVCCLKRFILLLGTTATLRFYGIEEGAVLTVVFTPNIDMHSNLVRAVRDILGPSYPTAAIPAIIVHFKYVSFDPHIVMTF